MQFGNTGVSQNLQHGVHKYRLSLIPNPGTTYDGKDEKMSEGYINLEA